MSQGAIPALYDAVPHEMPDALVALITSGWARVGYGPQVQPAPRRGVVSHVAKA